MAAETDAGISRVLEFHGFQFDPTTLDLMDAAGQRIALRRKSSVFLAKLLESKGDIVRKEDLLEEIWPNVQVSEEGLTQCVRDIRRALADNEHKIIVTHIGNGFSLTVENVHPQTAAVSLGKTRKFGLLALALLAGLAMVVWFSFGKSDPADPRPRIAVLQFEDVSNAPDRGFLGSGVSEGNINRLAQFPELSVIAANSSLQFDPTKQTLGEIAEALSADIILEGSKQSIADKLVVTANLIDTQSQEHLWSQEFVGEIAELFVYQSKTANRIGSAVGSRHPHRAISTS